MKYALVFLAFVGAAFTLTKQDAQTPCDHEGNNKNPGDCCSFYSCRQDGWDNWISELLYCPPHTAYSELINKCVEPSKVPGCETVDCPKQGDDLLTQTPCDREGNNQNPGDCCSFYSCRQDGWENWISELLYCPAHTAYSPLVNKCIEPSKVPGCEAVDCPKQGDDLLGQVPERSPCKKEGNNQNPDDCCSFYSCSKDVLGRWKYDTLFCPAHTVYAPVIDRCIHPKFVKGCQDVDCPKQEILAQGEADSPCKHAGNNKNPDDCCTFYSCWYDQFGNWVYNTLHCPAHSAFSEEEDSCVAPAKVPGCETVDCPKPEP